LGNRSTPKWAWDGEINPASITVIAERW
jgi:hypothetical protein